MGSGKDSGGAGWSKASPCPWRQTIARAELAAIVHVLKEGSVGTIVTDNSGIQKKCNAIQSGLINKHEVLRGANADLWCEVWQVLRADSGWIIEWMPSRLTREEAIEARVPAEAWEGNSKGDEAAKAQARNMDPPMQLLGKWDDKQKAEDAVMTLIAESQVLHLAARPRRHDGTAAKTRKRKAPRRPGNNARKRTAEASAA